MIDSNATNPSRFRLAFIVSSLLWLLFLVSGFWFWFVGLRMHLAGIPSQKPETRNQKLETRNQEPTIHTEARSSDRPSLRAARAASRPARRRTSATGKSR